MNTVDTHTDLIDILKMNLCYLQLLYLWLCFSLCS